MEHPVSAFARFLGRTLLLLAAIAAALACAQWLRGQWPAIQRISSQLPSLRQAHAELERRQDIIARTLAQELGQLGSSGLAQIDARIRSVDREIARLRGPEGRTGAHAPALSAVFAGGEAVTEHLFRSAMRQVELELRRQEQAHLVVLRARAEAMLGRQAALDRLERLRREHLTAYAAVQEVLRRRTALEAAAGIRGKLFFTDAYRRLRELEAQARLLRARNDAAHRNYLAQRAVLGSLAAPRAVAAFEIDRTRLAAAGAPLRNELDQLERLAADSHAWAAWQVMQPLLWKAAMILLSCWAALGALRMFSYYVLAPLAARRPPIVIAPCRATARTPSPAGPGAATGSASISAVSLEIRLPPGDELWIRPDYCQSLPDTAEVGTRLLFDWRRPFTSLAAHLWMLTRVRASRALDVVVSPTTDPLDEVALLTVPPGQSFVLQPRGLVGVVARGGRLPAIRSHWRPGTLHAWLTLQLRYLAFDGPAVLVLRGCRGVRLEAAGADRSVRQDATLGFSAHACYSTTRSRPFRPYLFGRQPLLVDRFAGPDACFVYEELPRQRQPGRWSNHPLAVLRDAGMKAFGI